MHKQQMPMQNFVLDYGCALTLRIDFEDSHFEGHFMANYCIQIIKHMCNQLDF